MARFPFRMLLLAAVPLLAGCQSGASQPNLNLLMSPVDAQRLGFGHRWSTDLNAQRGASVSQAVILSDMIVVIETPSNLVTALSLADASVLWIRRVASPVDALFEPVRSGDRILICSQTQLIVLASSNGVLLDVHKLPTAVSHAPVLIGDLAIFGGMNGRVFAYDVSTRYVRWAHQLSAPIVARPVLTPEHVFAADTRGDYVLLAAASGRELGRGRAFARVRAAPAATPQGIFLPSEDRTLYALNRLTLQDRWKYRAPQPLSVTPVILQDVVYLPVPGHGLVAIDSVGGTELWKASGRDARPIARSQQTLLMHDGTQLIVVNSESGKTIRHVPTRPLHTVLRTATGSLILVSPNAWLMRLDRL